MSFNHASSAGIIGQSMVSALSTAIAPLASAETLSGRVMPQMPGPSISGAGTIKSEGMTNLRAKQAFSAWAPPHRPLGAAEESAALQTKSGGKHKQDRPNATRHFGKLRLLV